MAGEVAVVGVVAVPVALRLAVAVVVQLFGREQPVAVVVLPVAGLDVAGEVGRIEVVAVLGLRHPVPVGVHGRRVVVVDPAVVVVDPAVVVVGAAVVVVDPRVVVVDPRVVVVEHDVVVVGGQRRRLLVGAARQEQGQEQERQQAGTEHRDLRHKAILATLRLHPKAAR